MKATIATSLFSLTLALTLATTTAQEKSTLSFTIENDSFFGTDRYYTHGFRLQYMHKPNEVPEWTSTFLHNLPTLGMEVSGSASVSL